MTLKTKTSKNKRQLQRPDPTPVQKKPRLSGKQSAKTPSPGNASLGDSNTDSTHESEESE
jgi:hypothetical protein